MKHLLIQTCLIERWSPRARNADFLLQPSWTEVSSAERCNIQQKGGSMRVGASGQSVEFDAVGYFMPDADIKPMPQDAAHGDRITESRTGAIYQVRAVLDQTGREYFKKALLKAV
jgi:hypothetical protein